MNKLSNKSIRDKNCHETEWDNQLMVFIASKTGLEEHNEIYINTIFQLLSYPQSIGMLGILFSDC